ncbi:hypothetical protein [Ruegeria atlantica]|uniref:hypothetical protein n=1 Tax=Ruegeria atlantica TaxID=81569 RepID=UPI001479D156|nr:hypothetical protein [Ruegeria atlantica]
MKPAFALSFSSTGISLHHHSDGDWYCIGEVSLDAPDLNAQIIALRDQGFNLENDLNCKLLIPADQVRFLSVSTEGLSPEESAEKAQSELTDATPYALDELAFDTVTVGSTTHVAAVARQTLAEAQAFAADHGFVPVQYSTPIEDQVFPSEPLFEINAPETAAAAEPAEVEKPDKNAATEPAEADEPDKAEAAEPAGVDAPDKTEATEPAGVDAPDKTEATEPAGVDEPEKAEPAPAVHAIAASETPTEFRSTPTPNTAADTNPAPQFSRYAIPAAAAAVVAGIAVTVWSLTGTDEVEPAVAEVASVEEVLPSSSVDDQITSPAELEDAPQLTEVPQTETDQERDADLSATDAAILEALNTAPTSIELTDQEPELAAVAPDEAQQDQADADSSPDLITTDPAVLEALNVAPTTVEPVEREPEPAEDLAQADIKIVAPAPLPDPDLQPTEDLYLASLDSTDLSQDAVALPPVSSFETDLPFEQNALPAQAGVQFDLDERGLVTPSAEGTLNPDGVVVYLGRPAKVPPAVPVRFEQEPIEEDPTARLAQKRPNPRPANLLESFERQQLGGRTREELAVLRPKLRPDSLQSSPQIDETPTALAVVRVPRPKPRPAGLTRPASTNTANLGSTAAVNQNSDEAGSFQPKTVAPKIPSTASVARQATIDNAINLRKLNLIGVYGTPANRRALVRLPSGRYKKLKVGDRLDGGSVIAIGDSELRYQKRGRNVTLKMPRS